MDNTQIQIQFPSPGAWEKFTMTAVFPDKDGFVQHCRYTQERIPDNYLEAFAGVVSVLCVLSDDWQARQVWACLHDVAALPLVPGEDAACSHPRIIRSSRSGLILPSRFSNILPVPVTAA